ncbi:MULTISPECIES: hypothetical protein [unclassified Lentimonas]|uniref:hypothetical protein n=1 Tax=unclassified Lentimonas TaxID=2630993 RepID=UPI0013254557|nr:MULTISPECIES: hypothetical protein [unclassified Lentimonas]CAA6676589.1 Unannotated [Lentimonas sp. CC4]CAA6684747.1 Unannotated [Lentimonas sp. CC6]CAA7075383.1 Unannotated [Lentimonas sp. CC4]CAA7168954.1 Unannotated [Lentimonas sp. CC21]CAA7182208.1 Unannotated [Lentimonas sp. CC8]
MKALFPLLVVLFITGCISSDEPFYTEDSKIKDERLIGNYSDKSSSTSVTITENQNGGEDYKIELKTNDGVIILNGTLFKMDDHSYIDLIIESEDFAEQHLSPVPSGTDILKRIFIPKRHVIFGLEVNDESLTFRGNDHLALQNFKDNYIWKLKSIDLLKRIQIEEDLIHIPGDPELFLPTINEAYFKGDIFQKTETLSK